MRAAKSRSIVWTGDNLRDVIRVIGLHPSASKWSWDEYAEVVRTQRLEVFTKSGKMVAATKKQPEPKKRTTPTT